MSDSNYNDQRKVGWDEVPQSEIDRELAYWRTRRAQVVWLVPARYGDGSPTCSGSTEFPYSDVTRRQYTLFGRYHRQY